MGVKPTKSLAVRVYARRATLAVIVAVFVATSTVAPVAAISNILPERSAQGDPTSLVIGRLGNTNTLPVPETYAKLAYRNRPDSVRVFDGAFCKDSQYDQLAQASWSCSTSRPETEVYYDFQALNNDTGALGPVLRVLGSTMAANGGVNGNYTVNLSGLAGTVPSTDGRYFVQVRVHWARQNAASCTKDSPNSSSCWGGSNLFRLAVPRADDYITYAVTNGASSPLAVQTLVPGRNVFADVTFEFAPPCGATGAALRQPLRWTDADYGQSNQQGTISWELIDDSAPGGPRVVASQRDGQLGGQGDDRQYPASGGFDFQPNHKYRWVWRHVDDSNGVQLYLPFDSYNYVRVCAPTNPPPSNPPPSNPPPTNPPPSNPPPPGTPISSEDAVTKPYFNVTGGDVSAGPGMSLDGQDCAVPRVDKAGAVSWTRGPNENYLGAGTQYAAFVLNHLQEFATAQGSGIVPTGMSFANTAASQIDLNAGLYGGMFNGGACIPDYFADASDVQNGDRVLTGLPGFPGGGNVPNAARINYYINGDLYINSNVRFSGNYASVADIPSFWVVVKGNIFIDPAVAQLDGVYIAQPTSANPASKGIIYTCGNDSTPPFTPLGLDRDLHNVCNSTLTVNGSITGRQIWLMRTAGDVSSTPAETVNYSPEVWLTVRKRGGANYQITKYDSITSLPPVL